MKPNKVHIILDEDGDVYCVTDTWDLAQKIISDDIKSGNLGVGAYSFDANFFRAEDEK